MRDYFSVQTLTPPLDHDGLRRLARHGCLDLHRVSWLRSFLASDGTRMLCWYQALDAESVRFVLRQQGFSEGALWPADVSRSAGAETLDLGRAFVALEFHRTTTGPDATPANETVLAALSGAGHSIARTFTATDGAHFVCLVDGQDEASVSACLEAAGITPSDVWRCVALDPHPPKLFQGRAPAADSPLARSIPPAARDGEAPLASEAEGELLDAVIVGAGLSGICALERLLRMGLRVRLYEAASDVGGVWHWNRYPGARVDSESHTYGFSFSEEILRTWQWRELFAAQPEVESYLRFVVERLDLRRHMQFGTRLVSARFDEDGGRWQLETHGGERVAARYFVAATGALSAAQLPGYPGVAEFAGESHHTARWPTKPVELAGRRVGVIGTGATGVQVIQTIASQVGHLTVFQRTPNYCVPQRNRKLSGEEWQEIERHWSDIFAACRTSYGGFIHYFDPRPGLALSEPMREAKFEALWQKPGFAFWLGNFADLLMSAEVNAHASEFVRRKIRARIRDPEVARKLLPDHPFGTKRVPLEDGYYEVYNRDNVRLVDLRETPIVRITPAGVRTLREEHPLDVIIYATGFDAGTGALTRIDIRGEGGRTLEDKWRQGPKTYLGLLVSGFPNLFLVNGPHTPLCNAGRCIEQNVDWIAGCIEHLRAHGLTRIAATPVAEQEWTAHVDDVAEATLLARMTNSWFFGANTPGKARRVTIYAAGARAYREQCDEVAQAGYPGCMVS